MGTRPNSSAFASGQTKVVLWCLTRGVYIVLAAVCRGGSSLKRCSGQSLAFARGRRSLKQFRVQMHLPAQEPKKLKTI
eukprot:1639939-Rhodomonas_salina.1